MLTKLGNTYYINLKDGYGNLIDVFTHFFSLDYNRTVNNVGKLELHPELLLPGSLAKRRGRVYLHVPRHRNHLDNRFLRYLSR
jgi:hypothetical protein